MRARGGGPMVRWFVAGLGAFGLVACEGDDGPPPVFNTQPTFDTGEQPLGPLGETRLRVGAFFRYDDETRVPGPWFDESTGASTSAIQFIVGDDEYNGLDGLWCQVLVPISGEGAQLRIDLDDNQFWGANLQVDPADITTNCTEPEYQRIWDFYNGELIEFLTTNRDGSAPEWAVIIEDPGSAAVEWGVSSGFEKERIIGGEIRLSDRWLLGRVNAILTIGFRTDDSGVLVIDGTGDNVPILLSDVNVPFNSVVEGYYRMIGYQFQVISTAVAP